MKRITVGILAHVDAGKTTLAEALLYLSGATRKIGRVDTRDAHLDTHALERARGITIFAKQAVLRVGDVEITLVDTPGHVDFSSEMERTLRILDCAILVISGPDGIQGHTRTLWRLLEAYRVPTFIFVNKMDQPGTEAVPLMALLKRELSDRILPLETAPQGETLEQMALSDEAAMEVYLEQGTLPAEEIRRLIQDRSIFPAVFGSALHLEGVGSFLDGLAAQAPVQAYPEAFGARVFKVSRDAQGNRLTHLKITGGTLKVKDSLRTDTWEEKVDQIRVYSGDRFDTVPLAEAGRVCAVTGLSRAMPGEGIGFEAAAAAPMLEPVLSYRLLLPEGADERALLPSLRQLEEEEPALRLNWIEAHREIHVQVMGEVQLEVLEAVISERFGISVAFGEGKIVYKETLAEPSEGVGHFEPLRHYAEVHLLLEPGARGSGLRFEADCAEDLLDRSWQRLVLTHLQEKTHLGVLTGSPITDLKITLVSGRAHPRHTVGGDFREATYRAVRQGLRSGRSLLLEPYYAYRLELPTPSVGKAMAAIDQMGGTCEIGSTEGERTVLTGTAPVSAMRGYHLEVAAFTKGHGRLTTVLKGYDLCRDAASVIEGIGYDPERDLENPTGSIFCRQGAGFHVPWNEVPDHMHLESILKPSPFEPGGPDANDRTATASPWISLEEIDQILQNASFANQGRKSVWKQKSARESYYEGLSGTAPTLPRPSGAEYLLVDGYNVIHAWPELKALAEEDLEAARLRLQDILCNYNGLRNIRIIVVFDAYRVPGRRAETEAYHNLSLVFTAEAQTADQYIEKFTRDHREKLRITVATSDGLQQLIIRGSGCTLLSARELQQEVERVLGQMEEDHLSTGNPVRQALREALSEEEEARLKALGASDR